MTGHVHDEPRLIRSARQTACWLLGDNEERLRHSAAVAGRADSLADAVPDEQRSLLVAAAWLHDVGYAAALRDTGFHPVDGARFLRSMRWRSSVCDLVAHHSGSRFVAPLRGLARELAEFEWAQDPVSDALTVADQTIGPNGRPLSLEDRMRDMLDRHGPDSPNARAHPQRRAYFQGALQRVSRRRLEELGPTPAPRLPPGAGDPAVSQESLDRSPASGSVRTSSALR